MAEDQVYSSLGMADVQKGITEQWKKEHQTEANVQLIGKTKKMTKQDWIHSVYFRKLLVQYRALDKGYLADSPGRKLRAVLKGIVQGLSPCLDQRTMNCRVCPFKGRCYFLQLMVEDISKDYLPYVIDTKDTRGWQGLLAPGSEHSYEISLFGDKAELAEHMAGWIRRKPLISLKGKAGQSVRFELVSVGHADGGKVMRAEDLMEQYRNKGVFTRNHVRHLGIEFVTPLDVTFENKTITDPEELTFEVFLETVRRRIEGLATAHCGFEGEIPSLDMLLRPDEQVETIRNPDFRFVNAKGKKRCPDGRRTLEYIGGLKDRVSFVGNLAPHLPLVVLGEAVHIGKHTTQGLGKYRISSIDGKFV